MVDLFEKVTVKQTQKKTQKDKHKKSAKKETHDLFVQGTNDSSIVSKRSVESLYASAVDNCNTHYFNHFVKKAPRRTPVINRGYWIRMRSIRKAVEKIISLQPEGQRINIVNLGCGYDPLPFQLLDDRSINKKFLFCIDIDFPELAGYKAQMINMSPELLSITGNPLKERSAPGITFQTDNYALVGCDLSNRELYVSQMNALKANDVKTTNIFIAEVSLAYMTPEAANPIIQTSSTFYNSHFLILEQLMPAGEHHPFAKRMINHFKKMEAPLQCVATYPTVNDQIERFKSLGFASARARDLLGCWELVDDATRAKVASVEPFDEWEEFCYFGQHYINLHATNQVEVQVYSEELPHPAPELSSVPKKYDIHVNNKAKIERKFLSCFTVKESNYLTCGADQSRLSSTFQLNDSTYEYAEEVDAFTPSNFKARMASTMVSFDDTAYLIGGRKVPGVGLDEFWKLVLTSDGAFKWVQQPSLSGNRVKHATIKVGNGILMFGGINNDDGFEYYSLGTATWKKLTSNLPFTLESAVLFNEGSTIYVCGGLKHGEGIESFELNDSLYTIDLDLDQGVAKATKILQNKTLARYGSQGAAFSNDKLLVFGGVGTKLYDQNDTIVEINLDTLVVHPVPIDNDSWQKSNPLVGFGIIQEASQVWAIGGGAVCYGFGSVWGSVMCISLPSV